MVTYHEPLHPLEIFICEHSLLCDSELSLTFPLSRLSLSLCVKTRLVIGQRLGSLLSARLILLEVTCLNPNMRDLLGDCILLCIRLF